MTIRGYIDALRESSRESFDDLLTPWRTLPDLSTAVGLTGVAQKIAYAQYRSLVRESSSNVLATVLGLFLMAAAIWWIERGWTPIAWCIAMLACLFWGPMRALFRNQPQAGHDTPNNDLRRDEVELGRVCCVMGVLWGAIGFVFPVVVHDYASFFAVGQLMVCAGTLGLFVRHRTGIVWIPVPCAFLGGLSIALTGQFLNIAIGLGLLIAVALLIRLARMQNALITQTMLAAEERQALLQELDARRQEAERANVAKTRFLAAVSHDLRQPMHSVALLATALRQRATADTDLIEQIDASVHSMDDLLAALLDVSKLDTGSAPLQISSFPLKPLLQRLHKQFEAQALDKRIDLRVQADEHHIVSDVLQLQRVLANLLANAIRYTAPQGRVLLRCRLRGNTLWIQVWDSGIGIARAHRQRIFDEFFQVQRTSRHGREGLGLGLSIAQRAAQLLGHPLRVRSRLGRGSVFSVCVPVSRATQQLSDQRSNDVARLKTLLCNQLVLVIDDDHVVRAGMQALFASLQCHVLLADSTAAALRATQDGLRTPDLIVSDYRLSGDDTGVNAIVAVRAAAEEQIPALLMTAEIGAEPHVAARTLGVAVLPKPLQQHALVRALERLPLSTV